jgi:uncharacterized protein YlxP (DUF503 family)
MIIAAAEVKLYAPGVHSLKEKRMIVKSVIAKVQNKYRVSIAETDENDVHQTIVLGIACVAGNTAQGNSILDHVLNEIDASAEAEITEIQREVR